VNRMTRYALALALGLSTISTAAFAAGAQQPTQSANLIQSASVTDDGFQVGSGPTTMPGPYRFQLEQGPFAQVGPYDRPSQYNGGI
jgi:hypothetical protein